MSDKPISVLNASGFLFQLRVEEEVKATHSRHGWQVTAREHPWLHEKSGRSGFADLVFERDSLRLVVECKRSKLAHWYFPIPADARDNFHRAAIYWIQDITRMGQRLDWSTLDLMPMTYEATFCIVRGKGENDEPLIERYGSLLVNSIEAVAREEMLHQAGTGKVDLLLYAPLLVTNATLHAARCDVSKISLATGEIDSAEVLEVPFIRFRKGLSHHFPRPSRAAGLGEISEARQRTVFVVNAASLSVFLTKFNFRGGSFESLPWKEAARVNAPMSQDLWP